MRKGRVHLMVVLAVGVLLLAACKPKVPRQYLQPDEMEDLLYDYYVSQSLASEGTPAGSGEYVRQYNLQLVLKKYGMSQADFDSSLVYYYNHLEDLYKIYESVHERLSENAVALGASSSEVMRYATQSLTGDTANVWEGPRQHLILPKPPYHIFQFTQKADTSYHKGDNFLLTFNNTFLVQGGSKNATVVMTVCYENDSIVTQSVALSTMGSTSLRVPICNLKAKELKGYVYMPKRQGQDNENDMCLLMLDNIQLVRFHHKTDAQPSQPSPASLQDSLKVDSLRNDSTKRAARHRLGERPQSVKTDIRPINKPITK